MCRCVRDGYSLLVYIYICSYVVCGAFVWSMCTGIYIYSEAGGISEAGGACEWPVRHTSRG